MTGKAKKTTTTTQILKSDSMLCRSITFDRSAVDEETRTVNLSFSSEVPYERWFGMEILDHGKGSIRMERITSRAPLLLDHDPSKQIGVIESVKIGSDRRGYAEVRFGKSALADEVFQDVIDGIRSNVSVGYQIHKAKLEEENDDGPDVYRITDWSPHEVSMVSVPADFSVGVNRSASDSFEFEIETITEVKTMGDEVEIQAPVEKKIDVDSIKEQARKAELDRVKRINGIGEKYHATELARQFVDNGKSVDEFIDALAAQRDAQPETGDRPVTELGLSSKDTQRYSLLRAINAQASGSWKGAEYELECSRQIGEKLNREAKGFFVPYEIQMRTMNTAVDSAGGALVQQESAGFIEYLYNKTVVGSLGATYLPGLVGDLPIPKQTGKSTFYWLGEDDDGTNSEPTVGTVLLMPRTVAGAVPMTRKLMKQSSPAVEAMVQNDLNRGAALAIDVAALNGSGVDGEPLGVLNTTGIATSTIATPGTPTWAETVEFETDVETGNALMGSLAYVTTPTVRGSMKTTSKDTGSGIFVCSDNNMVNGYSCVSTNQMPSNGILFGDFSSIVIGMWGVLDLVTDTATKAASGGLVLRVFQDVDVAVRHIESFCKNA